MRKPVKVEHGSWSLPFACVLRSHHVHLRASRYLCARALRFQRRWRSWVRLSSSHMWGNEVVITYMIRVRCVLRGPSYHMTIQQKGVRIEIIPSIFISYSDKHILWAYANLHNCVLTIAILDVMYWPYGILSAYLKYSLQIFYLKIHTRCISFPFAIQSLYNHLAIAKQSLSKR